MAHPQGRQSPFPQGSDGRQVSHSRIKGIHFRFEKQREKHATKGVPPHKAGPILDDLDRKVYRDQAAKERNSPPSIRAAAPKKVRGKIPESPNKAFKQSQRQKYPKRRR